MAAKKSGFSRLFDEPPVTSYHYVENRLLVIDWASLSYHMFYSIASDANRKKYGLLDAEGEIELWRCKMITRILHYVSLFNPRHVIFALEGKAAWRRKFVEDYYSEHSEVYWNKSEYYVMSDNLLYMVQKASDDGFAVTKMDLKILPDLSGLKHRKLGEMPEKQQRMFWDIRTPTGTPILPSYKGQRKAKPWLFSIDKKVWAAYREQFAKELAPLFRAKAVQCIHAEGDDVIYASVMKYAGESDDVIVITRDSDMAQIGVKNVRLFNHQTDTFMVKDDPAKYLDHKVLTGDDSDNINGIAFVNQKDGKYKPDKKTQISDGGATALLEACPNIYTTAKENGWVDQYDRNRTLIDLSRVPDDVKKEIAAEMDKPYPELGGFERLDFWDIPDAVQRLYTSLQGVGFYAVNSSTSTTRFNPTLFARQQAELDRPIVDIGEDDVITSRNIGLDKELSDIDVDF